MRVGMLGTVAIMVMPGRREHGTPFTNSELVRVREWLCRGREDRMCGHRMEAAGRLNIWRPNSFVMCAEIDGAIAEPAGQADRMQTLAPDGPARAIVTAWLMDTVAISRGFAARPVAYSYTV